jgi:hypothetical protein
LLDGLLRAIVLTGAAVNARLRIDAGFVVHDFDRLGGAIVLAGSASVTFFQIYFDGHIQLLVSSAPPFGGERTPIHEAIRVSQENLRICGAVGISGGSPIFA